MKPETLATRLEERGIKITAMRLLVLKAMLEQPQAFSLMDLEIALETVDKSTIFRTITLFHQHHLIHSIDDGSGAMKYAVCNSNCTCELNDLHVHFYCTHCQKTTCLENISIPEIQLPPEFLLESVNFVLKGLCNKCAQAFERKG
ncbi:transcriptional regulator [Bacteroidia bacterium]|nr:transcriptional regulator [Bacteroidia bacterium]